jgi:hypothetical protein
MIRCTLHRADCDDPRCATHGTPETLWPDKIEMIDELRRPDPDHFRREYLQQWPIDTPETRHSRDCAYVTSDGPAPCTCAAGERA